MHTSFLPGLGLSFLAFTLSCCLFAFLTVMTRHQAPPVETAVVVVGVVAIPLTGEAAPTCVPVQLGPGVPPSGPGFPRYCPRNSSRSRCLFIRSTSQSTSTSQPSCQGRSGLSRGPFIWILDRSLRRQYVHCRGERLRFPFRASYSLRCLVYLRLLVKGVAMLSSISLVLLFVHIVERHDSPS